LPDPGHRGHERAEVAGNAGQDAALSDRAGRHPQRMVLAYRAGAPCPPARLSSLRRLAG
jgi:hypothetical protein